MTNAELDILEKALEDAKGYIEQAAARIAELEADAKRLDWLQRNYTWLQHSVPDDDIARNVWTVLGGAKGGEGGFVELTWTGDTPREAIDAAMAAEGEQ